MDKSNFKKRRGAGLISGLTLLLASALPQAVTAADEAAASALHTLINQLRSATADQHEAP